MIITYIIIGITVLVSFGAWNNPDLMRKFIMNPYTVERRGEYQRFITSGFIHQDHMHLLFNMITLYSFGNFLEQLFNMYFGGTGAVYYVVLYLLAIVVSEIPTYFKHKSNSRYNSLGASGGVSAIVFAVILFQPLVKIYMMPGFILGTLYIIYSYFQAKKAGDGINHDAHLFGAAFGILFCVILYPPVIQLFIDQISAWKMDLFQR
jgi:membrane associated rhomboid family serine protease